ncbi:DNA mismatch repair protein MSH2 [Hondaea fermentalgiana]|uniref:DNA mismatch repair protein MSH2 n=1 Tax=Hondaea fermentalgiana TaxID=2315210 RepID=A0A2R5GV33_9STRA|nr:DNA mismatch repair protein MSH2 [Hondaea fermentalgiana]|eukprot:GBG34706.1 DNA mismatch repair protein MSH2 [Hondaea fermentalgiana]
MEALVRCCRADAQRLADSIDGVSSAVDGARPLRVYRFFDRNGEYHQVVEDDARELATRFFHSSSVLKYADAPRRGEAENSATSASSKVPFLSLSPAVFASVVKVLLSEEATIVRTFELEAGTWTLKREGSAGRTSEFAREMDALSDLERAAVEQACVACVWIPNAASSGTIGVAIVNTTFRSVGATEVSLDALAGLLAQEGVSQCVVAGAEANATMSTKVELALRAAGARRLRQQQASKRMQSASDSAQILLEEVAALLGVDAISQIDAFLAETISRSASAGSALAVALSEFTDAGDPATSAINAGPFRAAQLSPEDSMYISPSTLEALCLTPRPAAMSAGRAAGSKPEYSSVFHSFGKACQTPMGVRRLARWLRRPSKDIVAIRRRHAAVAVLLEDIALAESISKSLRHVPDGERLALSLAGLRIKDGEASFASVKHALNALVSLFKLVRAAQRLCELCNANSSLAAIAVETGAPNTLQEAQPFADHIASIIDADALQRAFRQRGYNVRVRIRGHGQYDELPWSVDGAAKTERAPAGKGSRKRKRAVTLNLERNTVHGTVFRVTRADGQVLLRKNGPSQAHRVRVISRDKQGIKFTTEALSNIVKRHDALETEYLEAQAQIVSEALEVSRQHARLLLEAAGFVAVIDVLGAFAKTAKENEYCCPEMCDPVQQEEKESSPHSTAASEAVNLVNLRHVLAEQRLGREMYIANNFASPQHALNIISGPNMGGKSTYSSSVALAAILAQAGAFVPADSARLPVFDALLARGGGALDDSSTGSSTFMVEMRDIASILSVATPRSLVIVDEIGRGTSTDDGFALAKAIAEHFVDDIRCLVLFATHFHELAELTSSRPERVQNLQLTAQVRGDDVVMLYKVKSGAADRSYGISVAKMAQFPSAILEDAKKELERLEKDALASR